MRPTTRWISPLRPLATALAVIGATITLVAAGESSAQVPGGCNTPVSERNSEVGCYLTATQALGEMSDGPWFWHLSYYPNRDAAEAAKGLRGTVVEAFGKVWLHTIAEPDWRSSGGERVAMIGPLPIVAGKQYTARYMEAVFSPEMKTRTHRHSGPEAWYLISGTQCLETPEGITVVHAGESAIVAAGPPMSLSSVGTDTRRSVLLVLHDTLQPWVSFSSDWEPKGLCPK